MSRYQSAGVANDAILGKYLGLWLKSETKTIYIHQLSCSLPRSTWSLAGATPSTSKLSTPSISKLSTPSTSKLSTPSTSKLSTPSISKPSTPSISKLSTPLTSKLSILKCVYCLIADHWIKKLDSTCFHWFPNAKCKETKYQLWHRHE